MTSRILTRNVFGEFIKFSAVGTIGFLVDVLVLYIVIIFGGLNLYIARLISYLVAATTTWSLNRRFVFRNALNAHAISQWARFVIVNGLGGGINYGVYSVLVTSSKVCAAYPVAAVAIGSVAGLLFNFTASRRFVFG